jgi:hypothetical protein
VGLLSAPWAPAVDPALVPAWESLGAIRGREGAEVGVMVKAGADGRVAAIIVGPLPAPSDVVCSHERRQVVVAEALVGEDPALLAATIVYGLGRAEQDRQMHERVNSGAGNCLGREVAGRQDQA